MKLLYHGSTYLFEEIDLTKSKGFKDFGKGFYATEDPDQAKQIALTHMDRILAKQEAVYGKVQQKIIPYRYNLLYDDQLAQAMINSGDLQILQFPVADKEWLRFVLSNRISSVTTHNFDIVIGPTADARTSRILNKYRNLLIKSDYEIQLCNRVIRELNVERLKPQYFFGTERSLLTLKFAPEKRVVLKDDRRNSRNK